MDFLKKMFAKFHSHLREGSQITRVLGIPGGYPGIPKTRQPYLEGIPISLGIWVWGYPKHGDTQITVTPLFPANTQSRSQRLHSFWSAPRMQDLWDNQCQNAGELKSDWLLFFTGSLRERSVKTGNKST